MTKTKKRTIYFVFFLAAIVFSACEKNENNVESVEKTYKTSQTEYQENQKNMHLVMVDPPPENVKPYVEIPELRGMPLQLAKEIGDKAGFFVIQTGTIPSDLHFGSPFIIEQIPEPGMKANTVAVKVSGPIESFCKIHVLQDDDGVDVIPQSSPDLFFESLIINPALKNDRPTFIIWERDSTIVAKLLFIYPGEYSIKGKFSSSKINDQGCISEAEMVNIKSRYEQMLNKQSGESLELNEQQTFKQFQKDVETVTADNIDQLAIYMTPDFYQVFEEFCIDEQHFLLFKFTIGSVRQISYSDAFKRWYGLGPKACCKEIQGFHFVTPYIIFTPNADTSSNLPMLIHQISFVR